MAFSDVFGGSTIQAAQVAYRAVSLTANVTLVWPPDATTMTDFVARLMDVTPSAGGFAITFPDARAQSPGFDVLVSNIGSFTFTILASDGVTTLASIAAGQAVYLYLTNNATAVGTWRTVLFGVGASSLDAASLAGMGVKAIGATLNAASVVTTFASNRVFSAADRAGTFVWTGGTGTATLPTLASVGTDFVFGLRNQGTGVLTLTPVGGEFVNSAATLQLLPSDSCDVHYGWYTVGLGKSTQFNFTQLIKNVVGGTTTLTSTEAANVVQTYQGILAANQIIVLPAVVQVYYVSNATTGAYTLKFQSPTPGTTVTVPQGQNVILFSDGINVINASTSIAGVTNLVLAPGTAAAPPLSFTADSNTGIFQAASDTVSMAANGAEVFRVTTTEGPRFSGIAMTLGGLTLPYTPSAMGNAIQMAASSVSSNNTTGTLYLTGNAYSEDGGGNWKYSSATQRPMQLVVDPPGERVFFRYDAAAGAVGDPVVWTETFNFDGSSNALKGKLIIDSGTGSGGVVQSSPFALLNRIINGNFTINQRVYVSTTATAAGVYMHDRWKAGAGGCTYSFTQLPSDTSITITAGTLVQVVETVNVEGGFFTLSWSGSAQARIAINGAATAGAYAASPITTAASTAGQAITIEFNTGTLGKVQVQPGFNATIFERRPWGFELELCKRYYQKTFEYAQAPVQNSGVAAGNLWTILYSGAGADKSILADWRFSPELRTTPSITTTYSVNAATANWSGVGTPAPGGSSSSKNWAIYNNGAFAGTVNTLYQIHASVSAEL